MPTDYTDYSDFFYFFIICVNLCNLWAIFMVENVREGIWFRHNCGYNRTTTIRYRKAAWNLQLRKPGQKGEREWWHSLEDICQEGRRIFFIFFAWLIWLLNSNESPTPGISFLVTESFRTSHSSRSRRIITKDHWSFSDPRPWRQQSPQKSYRLHVPCHVQLF